MPKKKLITCEICALPDGIPRLNLVQVETEQGNYYSCRNCLLREEIEATYQELGRLLDKQHYYFCSLARSYWKQLKTAD